MPPTIELTTTLVQAIQGGEPDDDGFGFRLNDVRDPHALSYFESGCACARSALLYRLWEHLRAHDLFSPGTDLWLRTCEPDDIPPLPPGAALVEEHTVMVGVA